MAETVGSALNITLHPLVVINISDHFTRAKAQGGGETVPRVFGAVLGEQTGRHVELANSFEMKVSQAGDAVALDLDYLKLRLEQYKKTFPRYDMLGWYSTAASVLPGDLEIHQQLCEVNESMLYLALDPVAALAGGRELPIMVHETEVAIVNDTPTMRLSKISYKVDSIESERIAVDHVAHILPSGDSNSSSASFEPVYQVKKAIAHTDPKRVAFLLAQHMGGQYTAISMLSERIDVIRRYLRAVANKQVPTDHALLRQIKSLCSRLPALDSTGFREEFLQEQNNALLITYISTITKGIGAANEVVDKFNVAFDKHSRRRGIF